MHKIRMQTPHCTYRQRQNRDISDDVRYCIADEGALEVNAGTRNCGVPRSGNGRALKHANKNDGDSPRYRDHPQDDRCQTESLGRKYAGIHEQDRNLRQRDRCDIYAFKGYEQLFICQQNLHCLFLDILVLRSCFLPSRSS